MIDIQLLRSDLDDVVARLKTRGYQLEAAAFVELEADAGAAGEAQRRLERDRHRQEQGRRRVGDAA